MLRFPESTEKSQKIKYIVVFNPSLLLQEDVNLWFHKREPGSEAEGRQLNDDDADRRHRRLPRRRDPPLRHLRSPHHLLQV